MSEFFQQHWGDFVALSVLLLGVGLYVFVGESVVAGELIGAGLLGLRLKPAAKLNNGPPNAT